MARLTCRCRHVKNKATIGCNSPRILNSLLKIFPFSFFFFLKKPKHRGKYTFEKYPCPCELGFYLKVCCWSFVGGARLSSTKNAGIKIGAEDTGSLWVFRHQNGHKLCSVFNVVKHNVEKLIGWLQFQWNNKLTNRQVARQIWSVIWRYGIVFLRMTYLSVLTLRDNAAGSKTGMYCLI